MQATNSESKLFYNANFITLDDRYPRAEAMLVTGNASQPLARWKRLLRQRLWKRSA